MGLGFLDQGALGSALGLPLVEQENRRRRFLPPDLQPWRISDTQVTLERELNYGCADAMPAGVLPAGLAGRGGSQTGVGSLCPA